MMDAGREGRVKDMGVWCSECRESVMRVAV